MTLQFFRSKKNKEREKKLDIVPLDNEQIQLDWIKGLVEQIEFANRPEVLSDYFLELKVTKRRLEQ